MHYDSFMHHKRGTMSTLTIHALNSAVERRIRSKASKEGKSLNQTIKELLAESVGCAKGSSRAAESAFAEFTGLWSERDQQEFEASTADLRQIDAQDWK